MPKTNFSDVFIDYPNSFPEYYQYMYTYQDDVPFWRHNAKHHSQEKPIVYVGPGVGRLMTTLLEEFEILAIDRSPAMARTLLKKIDTLTRNGAQLKEFTFLQSDLCDVSSEINSNLIIIPCNVLTEWNSYAHIQNMLKTCNRILKPGGRLIIEVDNAASYYTERHLSSEGSVNCPDIFIGKRKTWIKHNPTDNVLDFEIELIPSNNKYEYRVFNLKHYAFTRNTFERTAGNSGFRVVNLYGAAHLGNSFSERSKYIVADLEKEGAA